MKTLSIYDHVSLDLLNAVAKQRGWKLDAMDDYEKFKEDSFKISKKSTIFAIADGETMSVKPGNKYPYPSGSGQAAEIFCAESIKQAEQLYQNFKESDITLVFQRANEAIKKFNIERGRTLATINFWDKDFYSTKAAFVTVKNQYIYWGSVNDSGVMIIDKDANIKLQTIEGWDHFNNARPPEWKNWSVKEKTLFRRKKFRNKIDFSGKQIGYGDMTGEENALKYLHSGLTKSEDGDMIILYTDGFTPYCNETSFRKLLLAWPNDLENKVKEMTKKHEHSEDFEHLYTWASEKSLIAIKL